KAWMISVAIALVIRLPSSPKVRWTNGTASASPSAASVAATHFFQRGRSSFAPVRYLLWKANDSSAKRFGSASTCARRNDQARYVRSCFGGVFRTTSETVVAYGGCFTSKASTFGVPTSEK